LRYLIDNLDFDADPEQPISDKTLLELARRATAFENGVAERGGQPFRFEFDLDRGGSASQAAIDWGANNADNWNSGYSPFAAGKAERAGKGWGNFSDFLFKPFRNGDAVGQSNDGNVDSAFLASQSDNLRKTAKGASSRI
jgi:hypothetical protein